MDGQIGIKAESEGRSLGRDDITVSTTEVPVPFHRTDGTPTLFAGFRVGWMDGTDGGIEYDMAAGAGCGSKYLTLQVTVPGHPTVYEYVDMADLFEARVIAILAELAAKVVEGEVVEEGAPAP